MGVLAGVAYTGDGVPASSMSVDFRDLNDDGYPDLTMTALAGETFSVRLNTAGKGLRMRPTSRAWACFQLAIGLERGGPDFDNDGHTRTCSTLLACQRNVHEYSHRQYRQANAVSAIRVGGSRM